MYLVHTGTQNYLHIDHSPWGLFGPMKHNQRNNRTIFKTINRVEAIYECSREGEYDTIRIKFREWSEWVLKPGYPDLKASTQTTGLH